MGGGKYEGQGMMVGHRGEGEHGLLIIRQHGVEEQYSNVSSPVNRMDSSPLSDQPISKPSFLLVQLSFWS